MSNTSGTGSNGSRMEVPEAKEAMNRFKMEIANELGVNLKQGYNGERPALRQDLSEARWFAV